MTMWFAIPGALLALFGLAAGLDALVNAHWSELATGVVLCLAGVGLLSLVWQQKPFPRRVDTEVDTEHEEAPPA